MHLWAKPSLADKFTQAVHWSIGQIGFYPSFATAFAFTSEFEPWPNVAHLQKCLRARSDIYRLIILTQHIDDLVDDARSQDVMTADFSRNTQGISQFLYDTRFVPSQYLSILHRLQKQGVMPLGTSLSYSNMFADLLHERATLQTNITAVFDPEKRNQLAQRHLEFTAVFFSFFFNMVQPFPASTPLSLREIKKTWPQIVLFSRLIQLTDDFSDILIDLEQEMRTGTAVPNAVLEKAMRTRQDYTALQAFSRRTMESSSCLSIMDLEGPLKEAVLTTITEIEGDLPLVKNEVPRRVMSAYWKNIQNAGFYTTHHPAIYAKRTQIALKTRNALAL